MMDAKACSGSTYHLPACGGTCGELDDGLPLTTGEGADEFTYAMDYLAHHPAPADRDTAIKDARAAYAEVVAERDCLRERLDAQQREADEYTRMTEGVLNDLREQLDAARQALTEITRTPYRDWHLNARIARAALGVEAAVREQEA